MQCKILFIKKWDVLKQLKLQGVAEAVRSNENKPDLIEKIDAVLQQWRQGDYVLGEQWFVYRFNLRKPLTPDSLDVAQENTDLTETAVGGLVVVTLSLRSCKILRFSTIC